MTRQQFIDKIYTLPEDTHFEDIDFGRTKKQKYERVEFSMSLWTTHTYQTMLLESLTTQFASKFYLAYAPETNHLVRVEIPCNVQIGALHDEIGDLLQVNEVVVMEIQKDTNLSDITTKTIE